ncbi:PPE family protein, partial [Mycobacterium tuberculosis]|nr:PPE family protein [Mycobacterium tuberculosis]
GGGNPADEEAAQMGLLGTSPLSNHPLAGDQVPQPGQHAVRVSRGGGNPADEEAAQMGLLGTSPLSNHPLAGDQVPQ